MRTRAAKRPTSWVGFKVHLSDTCEKDSPHLITHVETTTAPVSDDARTATIHERLKHKELVPDQHLVDTGYVDAQLLHRSQQDYGIDLVGPTRADYTWQAQQKTGFEAGQFQIDWQTKQATCPRSAARVAVGHLPSTIASTRSSRSHSRARTANAVRAVHRVRIRLVSVAPSPCVLNSTIKHYNRHGSVRRRKTSKLYMRAALG